VPSWVIGDLRSDTHRLTRCWPVWLIAQFRVAEGL